MTGPELRTIRRRLGLTQSELAQALGIEGRYPRIAIGRYERGECKIPGPVARLVERIAADLE